MLIFFLYAMEVYCRVSNLIDFFPLHVFGPPLGYSVYIALYYILCVANALMCIITVTYMYCYYIVLYCRGVSGGVCSSPSLSNAPL